MLVREKFHSAPSELSLTAEVCEQPLASVVTLNRGRSGDDAKRDCGSGQPSFETVVLQASNETTH